MIMQTDKNIYPNAEPTKPALKVVPRAIPDIEHLSRLVPDATYFPLKTNLKKPDNVNGYLGAVASFDVDWTGNTGWVMGGQPYFAIDVDIKKSHRGASALCRFLGIDLPDGLTEENAIDRLVDNLNTLIIGTPTGGIHIVYHQDLGFVADWPHPPASCEYRGKVGYLCAQGTHVEISADPVQNTATGDYFILKDRPVALAPAKILKELVEYKEPVLKSSGIPHEHTDHPLIIEALDSFMKSRPSAIGGQGGEGYRHSMVTARWAHDFGVSEEAALESMMTYWAHRCDPEWDAGELEAKIYDWYKGCENEHGSAIPMDVLAKINGVEIPGSEEDSDPLTDETRTTFRSTSHAERRTAFKAPSFIVEGIVPDKGNIYVAGSYGRLKSTTVDDLVFALATDSKWMDYFDVEHGFVVLHFPMEDDTGTDIRAEAWTKHRFDGKDLPADRYRVFDRRINMSDPDEVLNFIKQVKKDFPNRRFVVVFDTWARLISGIGQLEDTKIQPVMDNLDYLSRQLRGPIILPAHPPKGVKDGDENELTVSGLMNVMGSATGVLYLLKGKGGSTNLWVEKCRGAKDHYLLGTVTPTLYPTGIVDAKGRPVDTVLASFMPASSMPPSQQKVIEAGQDKATVLFALDMAFFFSSLYEASHAPLASLAKMCKEGQYWATPAVDLEPLLGPEPKDGYPLRKMPSYSGLYQKVKDLFLTPDPDRPGKMMSRGPVVLPDGQRQVHVTEVASTSREAGKEGKPKLMFHLTYVDPKKVMELAVDKRETEIRRQEDDFGQP